MLKSRKLFPPLAISASRFTPSGLVPNIKALVPSLNVSKTKVTESPVLKLKSRLRVEVMYWLSSSSAMIKTYKFCLSYMNLTCVCCLACSVSEGKYSQNGEEGARVDHCWSISPSIRMGVSVYLAKASACAQQVH